MREEVNKWWKKAKRDLSSAKYLFRGKRYEEASLFCQQSAEKALKAALLKSNKELIKIHDLVKLGKELGLDESLLNDCERLTYVYTDSRYPDTGTKAYTKEESAEDIKITKRILEWTKKLLSSN